MNGSSFELCSDHFGVAMLAVRQELEPSYKLVDVRSSSMLETRSFRNAKDAAMSIEAESPVLLLSVRSNGSSANSLLPAC